MYGVVEGWYFRGSDDNLGCSVEGYKCSVELVLLQSGLTLRSRPQINGRTGQHEEVHSSAACTYNHYSAHNHSPGVRYSKGSPIGKEIVQDLVHNTTPVVNITLQNLDVALADAARYRRTPCHRVHLVEASVVYVYREMDEAEEKESEVDDEEDDEWTVKSQD